MNLPKKLEATVDTVVVILEINGLIYLNPPRV